MERVRDNKMLADQNESDQLAEMYALDVKLGAKRRKQRENRKANKKLKRLELEAKSLAGLNKTPEDRGLTRHVNFVDIPDNSEVDPQKNDGTGPTGNINCTPLIIEVQTGDGSKVVEGYCNGERDNTYLRSNDGINGCNYGINGCNYVYRSNDCINGCNYVHRTKAEEYKMIPKLNISPRLSAMVSPEATIEHAKRNGKKRENLALSPTGIKITPEDKGSTHFIKGPLPDTSGALSRECSKVLEEYKNGEKTNKGVRSDGGINRDIYVYRTKEEENKLMAEMGMSPQLSTMVASEARMKKSVVENENGSEMTQKLTNYPTNVAQSSEVQKKNCIEGEVTNGGSVKPVRGVYKYRTKSEEYTILKDLGSCSQDAARFSSEATIMDNRKSNKNKGTKENHSLAVACVADEQGGNFLKALKNTEEINTKDGLRYAIVIDPGLSFSEGCEEIPHLGNTIGNPKIEQIEAPVREEEKVFHGRDCGDIAAEIVEHGDSTKAAEVAPSLKLGSLKRKRKPRYYDNPNSNLLMCHICGEDDHKAAECTMVRRKKPCYLCGGFRHTAKRCSQGRECFKCRGRGHLARDCLEEPSSNKNIDFCLRCGDSGHQMFVCQNKYSSEDLKHIQCYFCKDFGHLCCYSFKGQTVASCYNCGQSGHLGSECMRQENRTRYSVAKSFYNHEVKGRAGENGEYNKAGQCTNESTTAERTFSDKEILPNFAHEPLISGQGVPSNQG